MPLTWADLLIEGLTPDELTSLAPWAPIVDGQVSPIFVNRFGCWFFRRPSGTVDMLDVLAGRVSTVAPTSRKQFRADVNRPACQEAWLCTGLVARLHAAGKIPKPRECYAIAPHPAFGGPNPMVGSTVPVESVTIMSLRMWQSVCRQVRRLPA